MPTTPKLTVTPATVTANPGDIIENVAITAAGTGQLVVTFDGTTDLGEPIHGDFTIDRVHIYDLDWSWDPDKNNGDPQPPGLAVVITDVADNSWTATVTVP